jgi:hypothetical protein
LALLSIAELRQRGRFILFFDESGSAPSQSQVVENGIWPVRTIDLSSRLAAHIDTTSGGILSAQILLQFILRLLAKREVLIATNVEPTLALFNDDDRIALWKRLFSEIIDVPGILVATVKTDSILNPPRQVAETWYPLLRGELGALACDDRFRRGISEAND